MNQEVVASAPGKFVILGEHAVVYGKPAISVAIDRRFTVSVKKGSVNSMNGETTEFRANPHIKYILNNHPKNPITLTTDSKIPASSGLGSSAALSVAFSAAMKKLYGESCDLESVAKEAFDAEYYVQNSGSPMDTSTSAFGAGVGLNIPHEMDNFLWKIQKKDFSWDVSKITVPKMSFVIGYTGIRVPTGPLVEKVRKYRARNKFASDIVDEIGNVTLDGVEALKTNDVVKLGNLMTYNHKLLSILGVSCNELNKLVDASLPYSYGAKLTGAGGGGSMVALTDKPELVSKAIAARGGTPFTISTGVEGLKVSEQ